MNLLGPVLSVCLTLEQLLCCVEEWLCHFALPAARSETSDCSASSLALQCYLIIVLIHISSIAKDLEHSFVCLFDVNISSLMKCLSCLLIFKLGCLCFDCWVLRVLYIFWVKDSCQMGHLQMLSSSLKFVFERVFGMANTLKFFEAHFIHLFSLRHRHLL